MTFDEQLERALDTFTGRLREDVARQVRVLADELAAVAKAEAASRAEAASTAEAASHAEAASRAEAASHAEAASRAEAVSRAEAAVRAESAGRDAGTAGRLVDGIRAFDGARSLTDILDTLAKHAAQEASRVSVLLVRGDRFRGWRLMGFGPSLDTGNPIDIDAADAGVIARAARSATLASAEGDDLGAPPAFAQLPPGRPCMALPVVLSGQVVAVLYADGFRSNQASDTPNLEPGTLNLEALEILSRHAARCLEALTAVKAARSLTVGPEGLEVRG